MPLEQIIDEWGHVMLRIGVFFAAIILAWLLTRLNRRIFLRVQRRAKLQLSFFQHITSILIFLSVILLTLSAFNGVSSVWKTLLGGTAIISAVLAFVAQDVIKDILAGLMISLHHPFDLGNRIELEDGTAGIVEEMTMRHVVIKEIDSVRKVIPNSRINTMRLTNFSYKSAQRSANFRFSVGYETDIELAKQVVFDAVEESPYTVPEKKPDGSQTYRPVYFIAFADSALILSVTVYYEATTLTEVLKNDVNTRVRAALRKHNIEIPYNYVTVVQNGQQ